MVKLEIYNEKRWEVMKIVLLFFCAILGIILLSLLLIIFSSIKLNVKRARISNFDKGIKKRKIEKDFLIYIELHLFGKIKVARIRLKEELFQNLKRQAEKEDISRDVKKLKEINIKEIIKKLKIKTEELNLEAQIGIEDVILTSSVVTIISVALGIALRNLNHDKLYYNVMPVYQFGNIINVKFDCIVSVKVIHIIKVGYMLLKEKKINKDKVQRALYNYSYQ